METATPEALTFILGRRYCYEATAASIIGKGTFSTVYRGHKVHQLGPTSCRPSHSPALLRTNAATTPEASAAAALRSSDHAQPPHQQRLQEHERLGEVVAVKVLPRTADSEAEERVLRQLAAGPCPPCRHLLALRDCGHSRRCSYLVTRLYEGGSLAQLLWYLFQQRALPCFPLAATRAVVYQLCLALAALQASGVLHRDVKPENVLLTRWPLPQTAAAVASAGCGLSHEDGGRESGEGCRRGGRVAAAMALTAQEARALERCVVVLADFGASRRPSAPTNDVTDPHKNNNYHHHHHDAPARAEAVCDDSSDGGGVTPYYASPQRLARAPYSYEEDLYSLGVLFRDLLLGRVPSAKATADATPEALLQEVKRRHTKARPADAHQTDAAENKTSPEAQEEEEEVWMDLLRGMLRARTGRAAAARAPLTAAEALQHVWFTTAYGTDLAARERQGDTAMDEAEKIDTRRSPPVETLHPFSVAAESVPVAAAAATTTNTRAEPGPRPTMSTSGEEEEEELLVPRQREVSNVVLLTSTVSCYVSVLVSEAFATTDPTAATHHERGRADGTLQPPPPPDALATLFLLQLAQRLVRDGLRVLHQKARLCADDGRRRDGPARRAAHRRPATHFTRLAWFFSPRELAEDIRPRWRTMSSTLRHLIRSCPAALKARARAQPPPPTRDTSLLSSSSSSSSLSSSASSSPPSSLSSEAKETKSAENNRRYPTAPSHPAVPLLWQRAMACVRTALSFMDGLQDCYTTTTTADTAKKGEEEDEADTRNRAAQAQLRRALAIVRVLRGTPVLTPAECGRRTILVPAAAAAGTAPLTYYHLEPSASATAGTDGNHSHSNTDACHHYHDDGDDRKEGSHYHHQRQNKNSTALMDDSKTVQLSKPLLSAEETEKADTVVRSIQSMLLDLEGLLNKRKDK